MTVEEALLDGFDEDELREMLRVRLAVELDHITAADEPLRARVHEVAAWARRHGRMADLVTAIVAERPGLGLAVQVKAARTGAQAGRIVEDYDNGNGSQFRLGRMASDVAQLQRDMADVKAIVRRMEQQLATVQVSGRVNFGVVGWAIILVGTAAAALFVVASLGLLR